MLRARDGPSTQEARRNSTPTPEVGSLFPSPMSSPKMSEICKGYVPPNTEKATKWALTVFHCWRSQRNAKARGVDLCPDDLLVHYPQWNYKTVPIVMFRCVSVSELCFFKRKKMKNLQNGLLLIEHLSHSSNYTIL